MGWRGGGASAFRPLERRSMVLRGSSISCCSKPLVVLWKPIDGVGVGTKWWLHYWKNLQFLHY